MPHSIRMSSLFALAGLLVVAAIVRADEEKVPLEKVPKAVMDAVKAKFPDAKLKGASTEKEDGKTVYEIEFTYQGHHYDVTLEPDGKILDIEKEIEAKDLPKAVADALEAKYPKATYKTVEALSKADEKVTGYEVLLVTADKKTVEVKLDPSGKIEKEEKKDKKDDK